MDFPLKKDVLILCLAHSTPNASLTVAAFVLETTFLPFAPSLFFFCAVDLRSDLLKLCAFERGKQRSGRFLFFDVPQGPAMLPELSIRTQS